MATTVRITETYDLKTTINKLGVIGIHTPSSSQIRKMYPGLCKSHKFVRLIKCDVVGACASVLPADPLQVGVASGDVAPEDMFNPILYKPVSNESFETLINRMYVGSDVADFGSLAKVSSSISDDFQVYYSQLAESKNWKKAMPQRGFGLRGLYPICYSMINTYGNQVPIGSTVNVAGTDTPADYDVMDDTGVNAVASSLSTNSKQDYAVTFRGKSVKMPRIPMHYGPESVDEVPSFPIPKTWVACFLIPPARLHEFYYRMRVSWVIRFENVVSATAIGDKATFTAVGGGTYSKDFSYSSSKLDLENSEDSVDTDNVDIHKIMES